ncbi:MAG: hypothetical protein KZQ81_14290 [Candidatus Thiodiazotropha sp. (ex Rostrolucina anterorostrata)]|nr:hypothetical protein [Candidatus Thiodiazotropha sp. (ex Rostrolucina anterorostrata)]
MSNPYFNSSLYTVIPYSDANASDINNFSAGAEAGFDAVYAGMDGSGWTLANVNDGYVPVWDAAAGKAEWQDMGGVVGLDTYQVRANASDAPAFLDTVIGTGVSILTTSLDIILTVTDPQVQYITPEADITLTLPEPVGISEGYARRIIYNLSNSYSIRVDDPGDNFVGTIDAGDAYELTLLDNSGDGVWGSSKLSSASMVRAIAYTAYIYSTGSNKRSLVKIDTDKYLYTFHDSGGNRFRAVVMEVDTTTKIITYGTVVTINSNVWQSARNPIALTTSTVLIGYCDHGDDSIQAEVLTITGNTISRGTPLQVAGAGSIQAVELTYLSATKALVLHNEYYANVLEISGTTITQGAQTNIRGTNEWLDDNVYSGAFSDSKVLVSSYISSTVSDIMVLEISGTAITFGTPVQTTSNLVKPVRQISSSVMLCGRSTTLCYVSVSGTVPSLGGSVDIGTSVNKFQFLCDKDSTTVYATSYIDSSYGIAEINVEYPAISIIENRLLPAGVTSTSGGIAETSGGEYMLVLGEADKSRIVELAV